MLFLPSNVDDINRYYRNTYVKFKETGDRLMYISDVNSHRIVGQADTGGDGPPEEFVIYLSEAHPYEIDYVLPHKSFFQAADKAVLLSRIPAKQYQRGISQHNTSLQTFK